MMKSLYRRNLNSTKLIIEEEQQYKEDYQMRMIRENKIPGLLEFHGIGIQGFSQYQYDITGKVAFKAVYEKANLSRFELIEFLKKLSVLINTLKNYLLDVNGLLLNPEYIFCSDGMFYFCFLPVHKGDICIEFHELTEFIVSRADYQDKEAVFMAYQIHKASMEENYSLAQVLESVYENKMNEHKEGLIDREEEPDYEEEIGMGFPVVKERKTFPLFSGIRNRRKKKWGEWEE